MSDGGFTVPDELRELMQFLVSLGKGAVLNSDGITWYIRETKMEDVLPVCMN